MRLILAFLLLCMIATSCFPKKGKDSQTQVISFRFHLYQEPSSLDPSTLLSSSASYFFFNIWRGLYRWDEAEGLQPDGGHCQWKNPLKLQCEIQSTHLWSNGAPVTSEDYQRGFYHLATPSTQAPRSNMIQNLKNAKAIFRGQKKVEELGFEIINKSQFLLHFTKPDHDFLHKLASQALLPRPLQQPTATDKYFKLLSNGPYTIQNWKKGQWIELKPNPHYSGHPGRPPVQIYFIEDDQTAYRLYQKQELHFLRRLPSHWIAQHKNRKDFYQTPVARFDYVGFGPKLHPHKNLRLALAQAVDYQQLQVLLQALGRPGCPSLPDSIFKDGPCYNFDPVAAKKKWQPTEAWPKSFKIEFSQMGGEDIKKQMEFFLNQWQMHLGLSMELASLEQKTYLAKLKSNPPDIFRKGVGLDIPTCLHALETFAKNSEKNWLGLDSPKYEQILTDLRSASRSQTHDFCRKGLEFLIEEAWIIPLGQIHFSYLAHPDFKGWTLNSLNQLDLSNLHYSPRL